MAIGIIGGTGVYDLGAQAEMEHVRTPYGEAAISRATIGGREVIFLARHGFEHSLPPHRINYRANIWALRALGVREVLATQAVGSLNLRIAPGHFVILSQFLDWTRNRPSTFFDGEDGHVVHADVTHPYCPRLVGRLLRAGEFLQESLHGEAVYACMEGPRFETAAEIHALRLLGSDVVGMTNVPEVVLAREAGLCYTALCVICNWAAGMTEFPLTDDEVRLTMAGQTENLRRVIEQYIAIPGERDCLCEQLGFAALLPKL